MAPTVLVDGDSSIVIDEQYAPIYLVAWIGTPGAPAVRPYFEWSTRIINEAKRINKPCAIVVDSTNASRPSATTRAVIAKLSEDVPRAEHLVTVLTAIPSPLVRGALTAMQWITRDPWPMTVVGSMEEGVTKAIEIVKARGGTPPRALDAKRLVPLTRA